MSAHQIPRKAKVNLPKDPMACWLFEGSVTSGGIGKVCVAGKHQSCQRWMFEQLFGPVPEKMKIGTTCGNGLCFNPYHLVARTHAEAIRAGNTAVLTPGDLAEIRRVVVSDRNTAMADALALKFGCSRRAVQDVWRNATWAKNGRRSAARRTPTKHRTPAPPLLIPERRTA